MPQTQLIRQEVGISPNQANPVGWSATHTRDRLAQNDELDQSESLLQGFELENTENKVVYNGVEAEKVP